MGIYLVWFVLGMRRERGEWEIDYQPWGVTTFLVFMTDWFHYYILHNYCVGEGKLAWHFQPSRDGSQGEHEGSSTNLTTVMMMALFDRGAV